MSDERALIPPRPNLGPEPWREPVGLSLPALAVLLAAFAVFALYSARTFSRRRSHPSPQSPIAIASASARERLVDLSNTIRSTLAERFGPGWRAKTTRELATDSRLAASVGAAEFPGLIDFLDFVDQLKFAPERPNQEHAALEAKLTDWESRVSSWRVKIRAVPATKGVSSWRRNGLRAWRISLPRRRFDRLRS